MLRKNYANFIRNYPCKKAPRPSTKLYLYHCKLPRAKPYVTGINIRPVHFHNIYGKDSSMSTE